MPSPDEINDAIAKACGFSPERLNAMDIRIRAGRLPVVCALYTPLDEGELIRILATLEAKEDVTHVEAGD